MIEPSHIKFPKASLDGIRVYDLPDYNGYFEEEYVNSTEPWDYSRRGAELFRHRRSVKKISQYMKDRGILLELGCSKGLMTDLLIPYCARIYATDVSMTALNACKTRCNSKALKHYCRMEYYATTLPGLPFGPESFDMVSICDGFHGWWFSEEKKQLALQDAHRVLKTGGFAIITDFLMPDQNPAIFEEYLAAIRKGPLRIVEVSHLYDKPWYKMESLLKKTGLGKGMNRLLSNVPLAAMLNFAGWFLGKKASNHIIIIVQKD